jgi:transposase
MSTRSRKLTDTEQGLLVFGPEEVSARAPQPEPPGEVRFEQGQRQRLYVGEVPLRQYLEQNGQGWVVRLTQALEQMDFSDFTVRYQPGGRPPLHPRLMLGLIVYGMLCKQWSLRELEVLALRDVGAWWVCAGLVPDHTTLGRFMQLHAEYLSQEFFLAVTRQVKQQLGLKVGEVAGDGTVIEAAAGLGSLVKRERLEQRLAQAQHQAQQQPHPAQAQQPLQRLEQAQAQLAQREQARTQVGKSPQGLQVSSTEPEAMVQPLKHGPVRPSYKPAVLVHEKRIIVGQWLEPSSEVRSVQPLLVQHGQLMEALPQRMLLDAGFHALEVLHLALEAELDLLCPSGQARGEDDLKRKGAKGLFPKGLFRYEPQTDRYQCPAGAYLEPGSKFQHDGAGRAYRQYRTSACQGCALRAQCTHAQSGRRLKRFEGDELKEAMAQVLEHPAARACYGRRAALVEPVFAELKERQGLRRFHRRGTSKVAMEFALHCTAYNLKRLVRSQGLLVQFVLFARLPATPWRVVAITLVLYPL